MINSLIAFVCGIVTSALMLSITGLIVMRWQVFPFYDFYHSLLVGNSKDAFAYGKYIEFFLAFGVMPVLSFFTSLVSALVAKKRRYFLAQLSITPVLILLVYPFDALRIFLFMLLGSAIGTFGGVQFANVLKRMKGKGNVQERK